MSKTEISKTEMSTNDQFLAQVELAAERLASFQHELQSLPASTRLDIDERRQQIEDRCHALGESIMGWPEVKIGTASAVEDLGDAIDALEADFGAAMETESEAYRPLVDRQLRAWRSRADRLRLQGALASMEFRDDLDAVSDRLETVRGVVLVELRNAKSDANHLLVDTRNDVEDVLTDVRHAVERAADALTHKK